MKAGNLALGAVSLLDIFGFRSVERDLKVLKESALERARVTQISYEQAMAQNFRERKMGQLGAFFLGLASYALCVYEASLKSAPPEAALAAFATLPTLLFVSALVVARRFEKKFV